MTCISWLLDSPLKAPPDLADMADSIRGFLWPVLEALGKGEVLKRFWPPGGPWR
jgi:hypothetical protein